MSPGEQTADDGVRLAYKEWSIRAHRLADVAGNRTVAELELAASPDRIFVERIRRGTELLDATPDTILRSGDVVAMAARRSVLLSGSLPIREEVEDPALLEFPMELLHGTSQQIVRLLHRQVLIPAGGAHALNLGCADQNVGCIRKGRYAIRPTQ